LKASLHLTAGYDYAGPALEQHWPRLHRGDCEPYPSLDTLKGLVAIYPALKPTMPIEEATQLLQAAWYAFHRGKFEEAEKQGLAIGRLGFDVANKAANIRATYLETGEKKKLAMFLQAARRAEELQRHAPGLPNAWYLHAQAVGRHAQGLSIVDALAQGVAGKVRASLEKTLELEPHHADAHIALGAYHTEIIDKIGGVIGGLTYGVSSEAAVKHFEKAMKLNPDSAIARIEYAKALQILFGSSKTAQAARLYKQAAQSVAADAMECLDIALAQRQLEA
jgi:tetratricopeptide (TPR) repeat protein